MQRRVISHRLHCIQQTRAKRGKLRVGLSHPCDQVRVAWMGHPALFFDEPRNYYFTGSRISRMRSAGWLVKDLPDAARPADFDLLDGGVFAQAEVDSRVTGGGVADGGGDFVPLDGAVCGGELDLRADGHAVAFCAGELEQGPVVAVGGDVVEEFGGAVEDGDDHVDAAVVVDIAKGYAAMGGFLLKVRAD